MPVHAGHVAANPQALSVEGVDIGILAVLLLPAIMGLLYGFLNVLFSITAWVLALLVAVKFSGWISPLLEAHLEPLYRDVIAFAGVFIISLAFFSALGYFAVKLLGSAGLTAVDRFLGFFFGIGLGGVIITILVFLAGFTAMSKHEWWHEAVLIEPFQRVCVWGRRFISEDITVYHRYEPAREPHRGATGRFEPPAQSARGVSTCSWRRLQQRTCVELSDSLPNRMSTRHCLTA